MNFVICNDKDDFSLSFIMYIYKKYPKFLPSSDSTLEDIFNVTNEVEYVSLNMNEEEKIFYSTILWGHSWSRTMLATSKFIGLTKNSFFILAKVAFYYSAI